MFVFEFFFKCHYLSKNQFSKASIGIKETEFDADFQFTDTFLCKKLAEDSKRLDITHKMFFFRCQRRLVSGRRSGHILTIKSESYELLMLLKGAVRTKLG